MWFKRKPKNRRLGREYVLDVKLRSSQVRAARLRMAAVALGVVFAIVLGVFLSWKAGEWALNRLLYQNKAFAIEEIAVQTDGVLAVEQLRRWSGVHLGDNLLALDLARVARDLQLVSLVKSASVERILPHTLRIRVVERDPIAQVNRIQPRPNGGVETAVFFLDAEGFVMLPLDPRQRTVSGPTPPVQLPVIAGWNRGELQAGRRLESPQLQAALELLTAFERSPMEGLVDLARVDISTPEVLEVTTGQGSQITFGLSQLDQQLRRWHEVFDQAQQRNRAIATLDLAVTNNVPARWLEASSLPAAPVKPPRVARKKHV
jgi:cell division septal protein FtsQ